MSTTDRNNRPLRPTVASTSTKTRTSQTPFTPRLATTPSTAKPAAPRIVPRAPLLSPRVRPQETPAKEAPGASHVTPRSSTRTSRIGVSSGRSSPAIDDTPSDTRPRTGLAPVDALTSRNHGGGSAVGFTTGVSSRSRTSRPNSIVSDTRPKFGRSPPLSRSPDLGQTGASDRLENRFFHASDAKKQEPVAKKPEPKKPPTFFYADGHEDGKRGPANLPSPRLPAVEQRRPSGVTTNVDPNVAKSPPMLSPAFTSSSANMSYFPPTVPLSPLRSPSPSKENIHLSYRKGASQIFGVRPQPRPTPSVHDLISRAEMQETRRPSRTLTHRKSSSLSSMASANEQARRRSYTALDDTLPSSPLTHETSQMTSPHPTIPSIDTSLASPMAIGSPSESTLSPTKTITQLAADARRERKVLDLEISNSSLLAINASLERELRRQKAELKRFRRLSRAGRLSSATHSMPRSLSGDLETLDEDEDDDMDGMPPGWDDAEVSDSEDDSLVSGSGGRSPDVSSDRLAKDEKRLKLDLERHRELLVQSQAMNQSLKRCMYATDDMIRDGKKALEYHVRVSDVKLGGRILTGEDDEEDLTQDIVVDDDEFSGAPDDGMENAKGLLDVWRGVGRSAFNGSEGDRDSGIEVDKPYGLVSERHSSATDTNTDSGRPPEYAK
ncbi:hypothetical protein CERZMDRAFT_121180 [Cercospora zeae-maydis SCOH1-5]|uniref:Uncharacterized protein n=1 Tax=Cercospora zeae-maydis SCOH1-5 TaxID=717836 RepID=A0A6A6FFN1_9PEZI|nr:hypothetical protein CERZMDRAFT_121180 [Cercospora zeae-maydis SCOH1-5]